jgi:hypothetical protein
MQKMLLAVVFQVTIPLAVARVLAVVTLKEE